MPPVNKTESDKPKGTPAANRRWPHWLAVAGCILGGFVIIAEAGYLWLDRSYQQTITPGVRIGQLSVGGQSYLQTLERLQQYAKDIETNGLTFSANGKDVSVTPSALATDDPDLAVSLVSFDPERSVDAAYAVGRTGDFWNNLKAKVKALLFGQTVQFSYEFDGERIGTMLQEAFSEFAKPAQNAAITATGKKLTVQPEKSGEKLDFPTGLGVARSSLEAFAYPVRVTLNTITDEPIVTAVELEPLLADAETVLERGAVKLETSDNIETIEPEQIASWLIGKIEAGKAVLGFGLPAMDDFFTAIAKRVDVLPAEGRYELKDGKLVELKPGQLGKALDRAATLAAMETAYLRQGATTAVAVMTEKKPEFTEADVAELGALELLGTGYSNFSGSPNNRRHNIATGSAALHGLVIPPDKEFSLGETLGPIEKETGYLPELVIKGDKTVPEYGGGLCQVGTTTFRAAMAAGLPITERRNHSYSVSYYLENGLPGTDATIYPPHPDLRFLNDTGQYILIQVRSSGNDLYYDFWGKPDGRTAERTTPRVWDRVSPPPTKEIETTELAPGARKCTERAHTGLKAEFTYTIHYANGETKEQVFRSTYKPWQEVCLVGKAA